MHTPQLNQILYSLQFESVALKYFHNLFKLKLFSINLGSGVLLLLFLCLGSQNLKNRHELNLLNSKSAPLPTGFLIGVSFIVGFISGGSTATLAKNSKINKVR